MSLKEKFMNKMMGKMRIKPFNVVDHAGLPEMTVDRLPVEGDPLEIDREMYYVCETKGKEEDGLQEIGVIPLVVKNPGKVVNINSYTTII